MLLEPSFKEHVMLLCDSREEYDSAAIAYINEGLASDQLCIYASVLNGEQSHLSKISSGIQNYHDSIRNEELVIIDFKPFADAALEGDLTPFADLKMRIEAMLQKRVQEGKSDKVLVFAEAAGELSENHHFSKSIDLESWWDRVHAEWKSRRLNITIICPHPRVVLDKEEAARRNLAHVHSVTLELEKLRKGHNSTRARILIFEPDNELSWIYQRYFALSQTDAKVVKTIEDCLKEALVSGIDNNSFDLIVMDTHKIDNSWKEALQKIRTKTGQRVVFTTARNTEELRAQGIGRGDETILTKPFSMSKLISLVTREAGENIS